ncbi:VOC family protein [Aeromicrobium fastidiosum]|uniref:Uncharacterized protein n=1 Tax=Aeromicrobium fastidiosum TaxID=52699 RepID=A0A641AT96_9ACTN|nr:hypothetical protein [Aeromicrobium fastidiosum]KAA1380108.1 hypothetical protein ESP62_002580 [Aeromicrobium fastidiosum]MBP2389639.1 hypothetical protein [Aeromicrobium fastidiosum]
MKHGTFPIIRQVIIGAGDMEVAGKQMREAFGLAKGFADPLLEGINMDDETFRVGGESHLELVGALTPEAPIAKWCEKVGGGGGYGLAIQVPALGPFLERAEAVGARTIEDIVVYDRRIVQLHPGDLGILVELDEIPEAEKWFWDDVEADVSENPVIDDVLAVEISNPDPSALAQKWSTLFDVPAETVDGVLQIAIGARTARFVKGDVKMMTGCDVRVADGISPGTREVTVSGVAFTLV